MSPPVSLARIEELSDARLLVASIEQFVETLPPLDRRIYRLCAKGGLSYTAAAAVLGVSPGVVRNRLSQLRRRIRARFTPDR